MIDEASRRAIEQAAAELQAFVDRAGKPDTATSTDPDAFHAAKEALDRASVPLHEASIRQSLREG